MADRIITLDNNFEVLYEDGLDGGGHDHLPDFKNAVALSGKEHYDRAVEWCAGFGVIGFDFLNRAACGHMSFIECHAPAIRWLDETAKHNQIESKVTTYLTDTIASISDEVKWDLVLANPPHAFDISTTRAFEETVQQPQLADVLRLTCDLDFKIHKEFFENIKAHLLPGADIFISEVGYLEEIEKIALDSGLVVVARHPAPELSINSSTEAVVFHFKEPQ